MLNHQALEKGVDQEPRATSLHMATINHKGEKFDIVSEIDYDEVVTLLQAAQHRLLTLREVHYLAQCIYDSDPKDLIDDLKIKR